MDLNDLLNAGLKDEAGLLDIELPTPSAGAGQNPSPASIPDHQTFVGKDGRLYTIDEQGNIISVD